MPDARMAQVYDASGKRLDPNNLPTLNMGGSGPNEAAKTYRGDISMMGQGGTLYDAQNDPRYPVSPGFVDGTWANSGGVPGASGTTVAMKDPSQMPQGDYLAFAGDQQQAPGLSAIQKVASAVALPRVDPRGYLNWRPAVSAGPAPAGDPWGRLRIGAFNPQRGMVMGARPAIMGGQRVVAAPKVGFNGRTSVTSSELAGVNRGLGGQNALMPDSMNTSRWLTGY